ncbi:MAG: methionine gamma-lyase family protein [Candidatus Eremiobacteraeota bacterium]|nr:methionine gamma-lyase family protein [Candidatus Eremiobacteraeota bacterium]
MIEALLARFPFDERLRTVARSAARVAAAADRSARDPVAFAVLGAFLDEGVNESDLAASFGYGYDDAARERYESLLARIFGCERALARLSLVSGTHAIVAALGALLRPGDTLVAATGRPYDTLRNAIVEAEHSLVSRGIRYEEIRLGEKGVALKALAERCARGVAVVFVQRSRGYAPRRSLAAAECGAVVRAVKAAAPDAIVLVDNCYGELVENTEPTHHGADLVAGSLIKNLGGGLAPGGAYVAGRADLVERVAAYHYAPGLGSALGPNLGFGRSLLAGLFGAANLVGESLAGLDFAAALFAELGYEVDPGAGASRYDIVQAIRLGDLGLMLAFARGLQHALPINARFRPEPGAVPGYREPVVMSSGAFVSGATSELSCDGPLRPPYEIYLQGGTTREHVALGALFAADAVLKESAASPTQKESR